MHAATPATLCLQPIVYSIYTTVCMRAPVTFAAASMCTAASQCIMGFAVKSSLFKNSVLCATYEMHAANYARPTHCRAQDQDLEDIEQAVIRIGRQGRAIGQELEEQVSSIHALCAHLQAGSNKTSQSMQTAVYEYVHDANLTDQLRCIGCIHRQAVQGQVLSCMLVHDRHARIRLNMDRGGSLLTLAVLLAFLQGQMLDELDKDVDTTQSTLKAAQKRMQDLIRKSGSNTQLALIGVLIVILIILSVFAFM